MEVDLNELNLIIEELDDSIRLNAEKLLEYKDDDLTVVELLNNQKVSIEAKITCMLLKLGKEGRLDDISVNIKEQSKKIDFYKNFNDFNMNTNFNKSLVGFLKMNNAEIFKNIKDSLKCTGEYLTESMSQINAIYNNKDSRKTYENFKKTLEEFERENKNR